VPEQYVGSVVELFAQRKGEMQDMQPSIEVRGQHVMVQLLFAIQAGCCLHRTRARCRQSIR
jgi:predicted membrane GTPase involved in stress response